MKKIEVAFGGGVDTILFSIKENKFYSYEMDHEEVHARYGGRMYYRSLTGLSGAGFLEPGPADNDLIPFGFYRTDVKNEQKIATVHTVDGRPIFGYAPFISHGGIDGEKPFVLTDGRQVVFAPGNLVRDILLSWGNVRGREISLPYYDAHGCERRLDFALANPSHYKGVRATRFIDLRVAREEARNMATTSETMFEQKLGIVEKEGRGWFHVSADGYFDIKWDANPRDIEGEVVAGWNGAGDGLFWRRGHDRVEAFIEIERSAMNGGKYVVDETAKWLDYEENFSILGWFSKTTEEWTKYFMAKLTTKARKDYVYARQRTGVDTRRLMEENRDARICIQDSLDSGNCLPGTEQFIKRYGIKPDEGGCCSVDEILKNKSIDEMLENFNFQKVVHQKLVGQEVE